MKRLILIVTVLVAGLSCNIHAQCVQCDESETPLGTNASRLGTFTSATGNSAFSSGFYSSASGNYSTALGCYASASAMYSVAIGKNVQAQNTAFVFGRDATATGSNSFVIGSGYTGDVVLTNNISKSIMFAVNSSSPAMIIRQKSTNDIPAFVGVGTTDPKQEFHVNGSVMISGSNKSLLFATSASSTYGNFGIKYTGLGLNFYLPNEGSPTNNLLFIKNNGNIGVGTSSPTVKFEVSGTAKATSLQAVSLNVTGNINFRSLAGNSTKAVTINSDGNLLSADLSTFHDNLGNHTATQNLNLGGNKIVNGTSGNGGIFVATNGNVLIGAGNITPTKALEVNGTIRSKEVIVEVANWSDFVFDNNYHLMSLKDTESFIKQNGHLPNVPSATEVEKEGIGLGEMNAVLLQKIEELTLYVIELEKKIEELKGDKK